MNVSVYVEVLSTTPDDKKAPCALEKGSMIVSIVQSLL